MMRLALLLFLTLCAPIFARADGHVPLTRAFEAMKVGDWTSARTIASDVSPIAYDLIEWHRLRGGLGTPEEVMLFLDLNPDWPGLDWLRRKSEPVMLDASNADVLLFFREDLPQTAQGALAHARALEASGQSGSADAGIVLAWRSMAIGPQTHARMLEEHGDLLGEHHIARLDMLLWKDWKSNTDRMLPLVPEGYQKLAKARQGLRARVKGPDALVASVPANLQNDPGLSFERFVWRARKGRQEDAIELALASSKSAKTLGEPEQWANRRRSLSRQLMRNKDYKEGLCLGEPTSSIWRLVLRRSRMAKRLHLSAVSE